MGREPTNSINPYDIIQVAVREIEAMNAAVTARADNVRILVAALKGTEYQLDSQYDYDPGTYLPSAGTGLVDRGGHDGYSAVGGRTDDVPGQFDASWLDQHTGDTNDEVKGLETAYQQGGETDDALKPLLVQLRQMTETLAFAGRQWAQAGVAGVVGDATGDQVAKASGEIRAALHQIQWVGNDWNAGVRAQVETHLGAALTALGQAP